MKGEFVFRVSVAVLCLMVAATVDARPRYIDCTDSFECSLDSCCVLGGGRFSIPRCISLRGVFESCRPSGQLPQNLTVGYPDGEYVELTNVYSILCPCQPGLTCSERTGTCEDSSVSIMFNTIN